MKETAAPVADHLDKIFQGAYDRTLQTIQDDPMHNIFGESDEAKIAKLCKTNSKLANSIKLLVTDIFRDTSGATCNEREQIFHRLHNARTDSQQIANITRTIDCKQFSSKQINTFLQLVLLEIIGEMFKSLVNGAKHISEVVSVSVSDNDNTVLFYISGYIIRALEKKYSKIKNSDLKQTKMNIMRNLHCNSTAESFTNKFDKMLTLKDRGGLRKPCDNFFFLIREFENITRGSVDCKNVNETMLLKDNLKENILDGFMVKHYANEIFDYSETETGEAITEDCVNLFLTVRGHALAKLVKKTAAKATKHEKQCKTSHSLRDSLKTNDK